MKRMNQLLFCLVGLICMPLQGMVAPSIQRSTLGEVEYSTNFKGHRISTEILSCTFNVPCGQKHELVVTNMGKRVLMVLYEAYKNGSQVVSAVISSNYLPDHNDFTRMIDSATPNIRKAKKKLLAVIFYPFTDENSKDKLVDEIKGKCKSVVSYGYIPDSESDSNLKCDFYLKINGSSQKKSYFQTKHDGARKYYLKK